MCVPTLTVFNPGENSKLDLTSVSETLIEKSVSEPALTDLDEEIEKLQDLRDMLLSLFDDAEKDLDSNPNAYSEMQAILLEAFLSSFSEQTKRAILTDFLPKPEQTCVTEVEANADTLLFKMNILESIIKQFDEEKKVEDEKLMENDLGKREKKVKRKEKGAWS